MKHTITITYEVNAESWDLAVEAVIKAPFAYLTSCKVKAAGSRVVHVTPSTIKHAAEQLQEEHHE